MKRLFIAGLVAGVVTALAPTTANAVCVHYHDGSLHAHSGSCDHPYDGGCSFHAVNDTTPGGQLGGQDVWNGEIHLFVVPIDPNTSVPTGQSVTASCELLVNGVSQGTVLGPVSGTGVVAAAGSITYTAARTDIITMCDHVSIDGNPETVDCHDATTTQIVPQPVVDALELVINTAIDAANSVIDLLNQTVLSQLDPTICSVLLALAPVANSLPPNLLHIDADGDTHVGGALLALLGADTTDPSYDLFWDCPPYRV